MGSYCTRLVQPNLSNTEHNTKSRSSKMVQNTRQSNSDRKHDCFCKASDRWYLEGVAAGMRLCKLNNMLDRIEEKKTKPTEKEGKWLRVRSDDCAAEDTLGSSTLKGTTCSNASGDTVGKPH